MKISTVYSENEQPAKQQGGWMPVSHPVCSNENRVFNRPRQYQLVNQAGLRFSICENGSIDTIEQDDIRINLLRSSPVQAGCANIYLRIRSETTTAVPLLGPQSPGQCEFSKTSFGSQGAIQGIAYSCRVSLAARDALWYWDVNLTNMNTAAVKVDLIYVQDVGLVPSRNGEENEFYISQYIDYAALDWPQHGTVICCRQNEHVPGRKPWLALGSLGRVQSVSTDGMQFFGPASRATGQPRGLSASVLEGLLQKESAVVALQHEPMVLKPRTSEHTCFFGVYRAHHEVSSDAVNLDLVQTKVDRPRRIPSGPEPLACMPPAQSLFSNGAVFVSDDLREDELDELFGRERRFPEWVEGHLLSFFCGKHRHVVLRRKELLTERPHGHIMKTGTALIPQEFTMSTTAYMVGVFQSHVTQGNVNFNRFIGVHTNPFNFVRHTGQRIFIKQHDQYLLLAVPSAFEIGLHYCRWIYKQAGLLFEVTAWARPDSPQVILEVQVLKGLGPKWLISTQLEAEHQWHSADPIRDDRGLHFRFFPGKGSRLHQLYPNGSFVVEAGCPDQVKQYGGDELLFEDGRSRGLSFFVIETNATKNVELRVRGNLVASPVPANLTTNEQDGSVFQQDACKSRRAWCAMSRHVNLIDSPCSDGHEIDRVFEILPWFAQNAQVHYLVPHGLEQYGGAAWGTRDICQGPLEMLLCLGHFVPAKEILRKLFSNQNPDGNWPQWWMFDRYRSLRSSESHGDIIFWPILALSDYVAVSGDVDFLDERLPFYRKDRNAASERSVFEHVLWCFEHIELNRFIHGGSLVNYSEGDWNDAMQPADANLKKHLISSWMVQLSYQTLKRFSNMCRMAGREDLAAKMTSRCCSIQADFNRFLVRDGVVAGFGRVNDQQKVDLLLHPSDSITGIHYRLLPMIRGIISEIFTPEQAHAHAALIERHLKGPDGARLMDRPPHYHGGLQQYFKRAESSPYFGREVGLMYTHAHLRYAEAMAKMGHTDAFVRALQQVIPIQIQTLTPQANLRQSNCYYSSSDAAVASRYEVNQNYGKVLAGQVALNGGWRIYSSGPGIAVKLIVSVLLGLRHEYGKTIFDPVLPHRWNGLKIRVELCGRSVMIVYTIKGVGGLINDINVNGIRCAFEREPNPYRRGGAMIDDNQLRQLLNRQSNVIELTLL